MTEAKLRKLLGKGGRLKLTTSDGTVIWANAHLTHWIYSGDNYGFGMNFYDLRILPKGKQDGTKRRSKSTE